MKLKGKKTEFVEIDLPFDEVIARLRTEWVNIVAPDSWLEGDRWVTIDRYDPYKTERTVRKAIPEELEVRKAFDLLLDYFGKYEGQFRG